MKVKFTQTARIQYLKAIKIIQADRPSAALRFAATVKRTLRRLVDYPNSGRKLPEFPDLPHREIIVAPYRFFYRSEGDTVWIVAVWHGAQLPDSPEV